MIFSNLITCFINSFTLGMKSWSISHLLRGSKHIYIYILGFKPLKSSALNMGFVDKQHSRMQRRIVFEGGIINLEIIK